MLKFDYFSNCWVVLIFESKLGVKNCIIDTDADQSNVLIDPIKANILFYIAILRKKLTLLVEVQ